MHSDFFTNSTTFSSSKHFSTNSNTSFISQTDDLHWVWLSEARNVTSRTGGAENRRYNYVTL